MTESRLADPLNPPPCLEDCAACPDCCECIRAGGDGSVWGRSRRWAWWLTALTIAWNCIEAVVATISGWIAGSIALVGFGLDSIVEVASALVIGWRLSRTGDDEANERAERRAVRLVALTFFAVGAYVTYDAVAKLVGVAEPPEQSPVGLTIVALSLVVMPALAWAKRRVAAHLGSPALTADAAETQLCAYLSLVVLVGLAANSLFGWWWMDAVAGLVVAGLALREGRTAWEQGALCADAEGPAAQPIPCSVICCPACPLPA